MMQISGADIRREHPLEHPGITFRYRRPDGEQEQRFLGWIERRGDVLPSALHFSPIRLPSTPSLYWFLADLIDEGKIEAAPSPYPHLGYGVVFRVARAGAATDESLG